MTAQGLDCMIKADLILANLKTLFGEHLGNVGSRNSLALSASIMRSLAALALSANPFGNRKLDP